MDYSIDMHETIALTALPVTACPEHIRRVSVSSISEIKPVMDAPINNGILNSYTVNYHFSTFNRTCAEV